MPEEMEINNILLIISFLIENSLISDLKLNTGLDLISDFVLIIIKNIIKGDSLLDLTLRLKYLLILVRGGFSCVRIALPWKSPWNRKNKCKDQLSSKMHIQT